MIRRLPERRDATSIRSIEEDGGMYHVEFEDGAAWEFDDPAAIDLTKRDGKALRAFLEARS